MNPFRLWLALGLAAGVQPVAACTIFVLTDAERTLFCNNEDWFDPATRLWFVPSGRDHLGCAYVGFENGWAQGGMNEKGLAFDWVSGFEQTYEADARLKLLRGNPSERMLESCATIEDAIAFYQTYLEPDFRRSRIMIADRRGASVIIGARDGQLHFERRSESRGFGWAQRQVEASLAKSPKPTLAECEEILRACLQPGNGGTKYSNIFNLNSGEITVFPDPPRGDAAQLLLTDELAKGAHYYEIARLRQQVAEGPRALPPNMQRFYLDTFTPVADGVPNVARRVRKILEDAAAGRMRESDYTPEFWQRVAGAQRKIQTDLQQLGSLLSLTLVEQGATTDGRRYRYVFDFTKARVLGLYVIAANDRVVRFQSEFVEAKPGVRLGSN